MSSREGVCVLAELKMPEWESIARLGGIGHNTWVPSRLRTLFSMNRSLFASACLLAAATVGRAAEPVIDFNRDVRPILSNNCYACHGPDPKVRKGNLRLDTSDGATGKSGGAAGLVPGKPEKSELLHRVVLDSADADAMPPKRIGKHLTAKEVATLKTWIAQGAKYAQHWAYVKPERPSVPAVPKDWAKTPIDAFLSAKLDTVGLKPSVEADRAGLVRRVAFDLTGLPPTLKDVGNFLDDKAPNAYETMVDRLLAKPSFGEHWARNWLDLARYADSAGYADDPPRIIWPFRDYVIQSLNANKPFDQFTVEQIAGDLLPKPTDEQLTATAFHRNTMTNSEGGTIDEEFRSVAIVDRVNTTMSVWMGTSMACAQCHTHKYDPITQTEYFGLYAILNQSEDADRGDETPRHSLPEPAERKLKRADVTKQLAEAEKALKAAASADQPAAKSKVDGLKKELAAIPTAVSVPVMRELPEGKKRVTKLQYRGSYLDLGDVVTEGVPAAFPRLTKGEPFNRLALAKWLVSAENPLTARVAVNRYWEQIFGTGIVKTSEEFGSQGDLPSHPELLDWLAVEFREQKWDVKKFIKMLVMTAAYRQSSKVTADQLEKDPDNRYYARGPRFRMSAEMVRDQALAVSGLLSEKMYGPSVRPLRPNSGLTAAFGGGLDWSPSAGEDRFRRGLYTEWRRTSPYPSMVTFDAPSREACTVRRIRTNTPLQALVTLNDPVYVEAAQALGRKVATTPGTTAERIALAFRMCLCRPPTDKESSVLLKLFDESKAKYDKDAKGATELATNPIGPLPKGASAAELAAWTTAMNVLLNLDEMFLRR